MLSLRHINKCVRQHTARLLSSQAPSQGSHGSARPWFVDDDGDTRHQPPPPHLASSAQTSTLPGELPEHIIALHDALCKSPHLQAGGVEVRPPLPTQPGPVLLEAQPKGRRRRGGTNSGIGIPDASSGPWRWLVLAQVKEGTENRGAIESVMRLVRRTLLTATTPVPLPPNRKRRVQDGWGMLDAGEFAVHVLSRSARERYFPIENSTARTWTWQ